MHHISTDTTIGIIGAIRLHIHTHPHPTQKQQGDDLFIIVENLRKYLLSDEILEATGHGTKPIFLGRPFLPPHEKVGVSLGSVCCCVLLEWGIAVYFFSP